jgi:Leucine-rich repeat (LRR) protein
MKLSFCILSLFLLIKLSAAKSKSEATCQFGRHEENDLYYCELFNATVIDRQEDLSISGKHAPKFSDANVNRLTATSCLIQHIPPVIFAKFPNLIALELQNVGLIDIHTRTFFNCSNLENINLQGNQLTNIATGTFQRCRNLATIDLQGNNISQIEREAFGSLSKLKTLNLENNALDVTVEPFVNLPNLKTLNLASNNFTILPENLIHNLSLNTLDLSENDLLDIPNNFFQNSQTLSKLFLDGNQLSLLYSMPFQELSNLKTLHLRRNLLMYVHQSLFSPLISLKELRIESNFIVAVNPYAFSSFENALITLDLSHNNFASINTNPRLPLGALKQLTTLDLSFNSIFYLEIDFGLHECSSLEDLYLNDNRIYFINEHMFENLQKLNYLHLSNNNLITLPLSVFSHNPNLRYLMMTNNSLTRLESALFQPIQQLVRFDAINNAISKIEPNFLDVISNVAILRLSTNVCISRNFPNGTAPEIKFFTDCFTNYTSSELEVITMPPIPTPSPKRKTNGSVRFQAYEVTFLTITYWCFYTLLKLKIVHEM